jgi:pimeloyl-ACP methyl ester carboxylesterase
MKSQLIFLPGLGADGRLFLHQRRAFKNSVFPPWLVPSKGEDLTDYARRWAGKLKLNAGCILVGVSFGGMVAQEISRLVKLRAVILISSCRSPESIPAHLKWASNLPTWPRLSKLLCHIFPRISGHFLGAETPEQRDLLIRMFLDTPDDFARWTVRAIRSWNGYHLAGTRIYHIHGNKDHLIPLGKVKPDRVILGGGHLINLTHPREVNGFIRDCLRK